MPATWRASERRRSESRFPRHARGRKNPAHPIAVSPVARGAVGAWQEMAAGHGVKLGFVDALNGLSGFVLTGEFAGERNEMAKKLAV